MIIFKDKITGDELFTDACRPKLSDDGTCFVFDTQMKTYREGDVDGALIGANASQEEQAEESEVATETCFDFVRESRLQPLEFGTKKDFQTYFKGYFKKLVEKVTQETPDKVPEVKERAQTFFKDFLPKWDEYSFFQGQKSCENGGEGIPCVVVWNDDGMSGKCYVLREALVEEKV